jgi:hypothetical protein
MLISLFGTHEVVTVCIYIDPIQGLSCITFTSSMISRTSIWWLRATLCGAGGKSVPSRSCAGQEENQYLQGLVLGRRRRR